MKELKLPAVDLFTDDSVQIGPSVALQVLKLERSMNDVIWNVATAHAACLGVPAAELEAPVKAYRVRQVRWACAVAADTMAEPGSALPRLPLRRSTALCRSWLSCARALADGLDMMLTSACADTVNRERSNLEGLCPRWDEAITAHEVRDDVAKLTLLKNSGIQKLPAAVKRLAKAVEALKTTELLLGKSDPSANPATKDTIQLAENASAFARQTVSVAAAVRILFTVPIDMAAVSTCLTKLVGSLPRPLVERLENAAGRVKEEAKSSSSRKRGKGQSAPSIADCLGEAASSLLTQPKDEPAEGAAKRSRY